MVSENGVKAQWYWLILKTYGDYDILLIYPLMPSPAVLAQWRWDLHAVCCGGD